MNTTPSLKFDAISHAQSIFDRRSTAPLFIDHETDRELSYGQAQVTAHKIAQALRAQGIAPGDRVTIIADNSLEMATLLLGIWTLGACAVPLNPQLARQHLSEILAALQPRIVLAGTNHRGLAEDAITTSGASISLQVFGTKDQPIDVADLATQTCIDIGPEIEKAMALTNTQALPIFDALDQDAVMMIIFTSGSTAAPKGVQIALRNVMANEHLFCQALKLDENSRFMHMFPMSYLAGTHNLLLLPISVGASIVITPTLGGATLFEFWDIVRRRQINTLWFTATMLSMLQTADDGEDMDWLRAQIRCGIVGMAPLPLATKQEFEGRFGFVLHENFALSETTFISSSLPGKPHAEGSKGHILPNVQVNIRAPSDRLKELPEGEEGEILVQAPFLMKGYFNASDDDNANLTEEGFLTGDLGYVREGQLFITGRKKDLIIRGGINIAPSLVEASIAALDGISAVSVVGLPHPVYGEEVAAAIVLNKGCHPEGYDKKAMSKALKGKLAYFQQPKSWLILDALPQGLTGKPDKRAIIELMTKKG